MTRTELLSLAERLDTINPAGKSSAELDADELFLQGAAIILRKLAELRPVAWRYQDARGHYRYRGYKPGFAKEYAILKPVALYQLSEVLTDE